MMKKILKSIFSVLAGFMAVLVLSIGTDIALQKAGVFPGQNNPAAYVPWMLLLALTFRCVYAVVGGYVTAMLAPGRAMHHVLALGILGFVSATLGSIVNWDKVIPGTAWYPALLVALTLPCVLLGGKLKTGDSITSEPEKQPNSAQEKIGDKICLNKW